MVYRWLVRGVRAVHRGDRRARVELGAGRLSRLPVDPQGGGQGGWRRVWFIWLNAYHRAPRAAAEPSPASVTSLRENMRVL